MEQSRTHLKPHERDLIAFHTAAGMPIKAIAALLGRALSTIKRELKRGAPPGEEYLATRAQTLADERRKPSNGRPVKLSTDAGLALAARLLELMRTERRSVGQALMLVLKTGEHMVSVCRQTAYQWMYESSTQIAYQMCEQMIRPRFYRKPRRKTDTGAGKIVDMVMLEERPQACQDRSEAGHLEGDLIIGKNSKTALITLVDRKTRWMVILPTVSKTANDVTRALKTWVARQPVGAVKSLTWDQGPEASYHAWFTTMTGVPFYFAKAHSPWLRGSNENANGVARRYFPKSTVLTQDPEETARVSRLLNSRPMPVLSGATPEELNSKPGGGSLQI